MLDLAIKSKNIIIDKSNYNGLLLVQDGRIADVVPADTAVACPVLEVGDRAVLPGVIDPHVHINEPGRTEWEGFDTATRAALSGELPRW
ncbi:hypothetical protein [Hymenobacter sp. 5414T-23]|uniref:hypothetical protein n=1 Tax=Hymenobacter sp. 5414T-23 TaxID=2932252 RepID=UPI001FD0A909|nr:hypothetical protein [Hymenobacter sp. 5414T-23]UOQ82172.1 hypothetical protein MUN83_05205 [Hymenobacter sp. 5414T-23]